MKVLRTALLALALLMTILNGCGGGGAGGLAGVIGGPGGGGIGGTGVTSSGTITGLGSIFVNGIRFSTDTADVFINGDPAGEDRLRVGMVVLVTGELDDDATGSASRVEYTNAVRGPVQILETNTERNFLRLQILGTEVIVERAATVFERVSFDSLSNGDVLEVSGFIDDRQRLRATRIERAGTFSPGETIIALGGVVRDLQGTEFSLGDFVVDFSAADVSSLPGGSVSVGIAVRVIGTLRGERITATRVLETTAIRRIVNADERLSLEGSITDFVDAGDFTVNEIAVDASNVSLATTDQPLQNGLVVQVVGRWNGSELLAESVQIRRGIIVVEAAASSVDSNNGSITLQLQDGAITVEVNNRTLIGDTTQQTDRVSLESISAGDFLAVEAIDTDRGLLASRVIRTALRGELLQARVQSFTSDMEVTLRGISFNTTETLFRDRSDRLITSEDFYQQLQVGDIIRIRDTQPADGIADLVLFHRD